MQLLAFREPSGRVFIIDEIHALPPLAEGYEWTMVVQPDRDQPAPSTPEQSTSADVPATASPDASPPGVPGIFDIALQVLTPRPGQTPEERGLELLGMLPADLRRNLAKLLRVIMPPTLPPFPRG